MGVWLLPGGFFNPAFLRAGDGAVSVYPVPSSGGADSYKVYYVNETPVNNNDTALTYADSYINYFPANKVYLIDLNEDAISICSDNIK